MFYYVYRITNKLLNKHYYGYRSSKIEPILDIGIRYFSSSTNKDFINDQKVNPLHYKYKVVRIFNNKLEAVRFEMFLHYKFDVRNNDKFYNLANQNMESFLTKNGSLFTKNYGWITTDEYKQNKEKYIIHERFLGALNKITQKKEIISYDVYNENKDIYEHPSLNKITCINLLNNKKVRISTKEFYNNPEKYQSLNKGLVAAFNIVTLQYTLVTVTELKSNNNLQHPSTNRISVFDKLENKTLSITKDTYLNNLERYVGVNKNKISGSNNPNKKKIAIYNSDNKIEFICDGNFKEICKVNNLPHNALRKSYSSGGMPIYSKYVTEKSKLFKNWYAKIL